MYYPAHLSRDCAYERLLSQRKPVLILAVELTTPVVFKGLKLFSNSNLCVFCIIVLNLHVVFDRALWIDVGYFPHKVQHFLLANLYLHRNISSQRSYVMLFFHCIFNRSSLFLSRGLITSYVSFPHLPFNRTLRRPQTNEMWRQECERMSR